VPLYEYSCAACGGFEVIRKFADPPLKKCPKCGKRVEKRPSAPAIQFKGTGWYITDYARKPADGAQKTPEGAGEGKTTAAAEGKAPAEGKSAPVDTPETGKKAASSKGKTSG